MCFWTKPVTSNDVIMMKMAPLKTFQVFFIGSIFLLQVFPASGESAISSDDLGNPDPTLASHSLGSNNVGLDDSDVVDDVVEPTLQGPNGCTKQET